MTNDSARTILEQMDNLLQPDTWIQGNYARRAHGESLGVHWQDREAQCFCLVGAMCRVTGIQPDGLTLAPETASAIILLNRAIKSNRLGEASEAHLVNWNDDPARQFPEVKAALRDAMLYA